MERNSQASQGYIIESQIREAYGRVVYTETCHNKRAERLLEINNRIKIIQIVLSAMTTGGFLTALIFDEQIATIVGAILSLLLLIFNSYTKNFNLVEEAQSHQQSANKLWKIREEYVSLLTDFELLEQREIISKRDELQARTGEVYANSPKTDRKSYKKAQKALKIEEEQTFSQREIDIMLPDTIRRCNRKMKD